MSTKEGSDHEPEDKEDKRDEEFHRRARDRLSGALSSAFDRAENNNTSSASDLLDGIPDLTAGLDSPLKRIINSSSPWGSPLKSPRTARRRRKKEPQAESVFHHTFVLKLFDRSVDLAQFEENTALYPVCRAWMKDKPHNRNFAPRIRTPTPEPSGYEDEGEVNGVVKQDKINVENGVEEESELDGGEPDVKKVKKEKGVYKLPTFEPLEANVLGEEVGLRIPADLQKPDRQEFTIKSIQSEELTVPNMMQSHMEHWQKVRRSWREAYGKNESRYRESLEMLREMFEK